MSFNYCMKLINSYYDDCLTAGIEPLQSARLSRIKLAHQQLIKSDQTKLKFMIMMKWGNLSGIKANSYGMLAGGFLFPFLDYIINDYSAARLIAYAIMGSCIGSYAANYTHTLFRTPAYRPRMDLVNRITITVGRTLGWESQCVNSKSESDSRESYRLSA